MNEGIFGMPYEEIRRQCAAENLKFDSNSPLEDFSTVEPCIEGGTRILADEKLKLRLMRIYTRSERYE